nr:ABC-three component system protein [Holdemanella biformis]
MKSASNDYYRACKQRTRWVRDELIYLDELAKYDIKLISEWEIAFAWMEDFLGNEVNINDEEKIKAGKKLYKEMMDKNIYIREHCQKPFIMRGSYHILANKLKVGWHIDYKEILKHLLEEKKDRND